ncbi:hypothetical protein PGT21_018154 [Puccinia graminis f. sp. tritici]|uniref:Uncharacterized protein n=1 Tax=Puccinia graminis f. sp. tritici TaxID=56615 RepID=A0A5B0QWL7_PUCGR|nr:hypothetical protein PGT21_018154 [Puccinia graminis f. sp. tritici]
MTNILRRPCSLWIHQLCPTHIFHPALKPSGLSLPLKASLLPAHPLLKPGSHIEGFPSPNPSSSQTRCSESPALPNPSSTEDQHSQSLINPALPQSQDSESPVNSAFHETTESDQPLNALSQDSEPTLNATSPREQDDRDSDLPENSVLLNQQDPIKIQGKMSFLVPPLLKIKETGAWSPPETMTWNRPVSTVHCFGIWLPLTLGHRLQEGARL